MILRHLGPRSSSSSMQLLSHRPCNSSLSRACPSRSVRYASSTRTGARTTAPAPAPAPPPLKRPAPLKPLPKLARHKTVPTRDIFTVFQDAVTKTANGEMLLYRAPPQRGYTAISTGSAITLLASGLWFLDLAWVDETWIESKWAQVTHAFAGLFLIGGGSLLLWRGRKMITNIRAVARPASGTSAGRQPGLGRGSAGKKTPQSQGKSKQQQQQQTSVDIHIDVRRRIPFAKPRHLVVSPSNISLTMRITVEPLNVDPEVVEAMRVQLVAQRQLRTMPFYKAPLRKTNYAIWRAYMTIRRMFTGEYFIPLTVRRLRSPEGKEDDVVEDEFQIDTLGEFSTEFHLFEDITVDAF